MHPSRGLAISAPNERRGPAVRTATKAPAAPAGGSVRQVLGLVTLGAGLVACATPSDEVCPTPNPAFEESCEPVVPTCRPADEARDAESFRNTFGSLSAEGTCQSDWPAPWLADCTERLPPGVPDLRGLWADEGHVERIEQCGDLVIIVGENYTHGGYATGVEADGVNDFVANDSCSIPNRVALLYEGNTLQFRVGDVVVVTRTLAVADDGEDELVWVFAGTERARMRRYCGLDDIPATAVSGLPAD